MLTEIQISAETRIVEVFDDRVVLYVRVSDAQDATVTMFIPRDETLSDADNEFDDSEGEGIVMDDFVNDFFHRANPGHSNEEWSNPEWRSMLIVEDVPVSRRITLRPHATSGKYYLKITCIELAEGRVLHGHWPY